MATKTRRGRVDAETISESERTLKKDGKNERLSAEGGKRERKPPTLYQPDAPKPDRSPAHKHSKRKLTQAAAFVTSKKRKPTASVTKNNGKEASAPKYDVEKEAEEAEDLTEDEEEHQPSAVHLKNRVQTLETDLKKALQKIEQLEESVKVKEAPRTPKPRPRKPKEV